MHTLTARGYMISRLNDGQILNLHAHEKRKGYPMPPCWISENYDLDRVGEVPSELYSDAERRVLAIYYQLLRDLDDDSSVNIYQEIDTTIRKQNLTFPIPTKAGRGESSLLKKVKNDQAEFIKLRTSVEDGEAPF